MQNKTFLVTDFDSVKFIPKRDNPNIVWTGFDKLDGAGYEALKKLEDALRDVQDHAVAVCVNRKGLKAQHNLKVLGYARTRKGIEIQILPNNTTLTLVITKDGTVVVPPFAAFNELVTVGRFEAAVGKAVELLMQ